MICFRLLDAEDPAQPLADAVHALAQGAATQDTYAVDPVSFRHVPNAPFAYWVSDTIRQLFTTLPPFENEERTAKVGLQTSDDFRFVRTAWETPLTPEELTQRNWYHFAKGGSYSPFYADIHLKVNWGNGSKEMWSIINPAINKPKSNIWMLGETIKTCFFKPGLTWPRRTTQFGLRILPKVCVFGDKGPAAFVDNDKPGVLLSLLAILLSKSADQLISLSLNAADKTARSFEVGVIQRTVIPEKKDERLPELAKSAWSKKRKPDAANLTSHAFVAPALAPRTQTF